MAVGIAIGFASCAAIMGVIWWLAFSPAPDHVPYSDREPWGEASSFRLTAPPTATASDAFAAIVLGLGLTAVVAVACAYILMVRS